jgi:hypothetical protein
MRNAAMQHAHGKMSQISDDLQGLRLFFDHLENSTLPFVTKNTKFAEELSKGRTDAAVT